MVMQFFYALTLGAFVGGLGGYIGSLMLTKRMSLIGGPLGHLALPGVAIAFAYGFDVSIGALLFLIFGTALIWFLQQQTKLPFEAITATVFASSYSIAFLFLKKGKTKSALLGDISQLSFTTVAINVLTALIVMLIVYRIYSRMILINISPDLAKTNGVNIRLYNFIYLTCIAVTIALGVRMVGGLMTAAIVAIPACTSRNITSRLHGYAFISLLAGIISCTVGIFLNTITGFDVGPMIIIVSTGLFLASVIAKSFVARNNHP